MLRNDTGSAITQWPNVGRIERWLLWKPTSNETKWLPLLGATIPPIGIAISDRKTRDTPGTRGGAFLSGVAHNLAYMEAAVGNLFNTVTPSFVVKLQVGFNCLILLI